MKKLIALLLALVTLASLLVSCGALTKVERGTREVDVYTNDSIDVTFTIPTGWNFYSDSEIAALMNISSDLWKDPELFENADVASVIDFMAVQNNAQNNVNLVFENLAASGNTAMSVSKYIETSKELMKEQLPGASYAFSENTKVTLGSETYTRVTATCAYNNISMIQYLYVRKVGTYMIVITATTNTKESPETFEAMFS